MRAVGVAGAALALLVVTAGTGAECAPDDSDPTAGAKVLTEPRRFYRPDGSQWPARGIVGLDFDLSGNSRWGLLSTDYLEFGFNVPYFCQKRCGREDCLWHCHIGLYYVWPADSRDSWQPRYRVQTSDGGALSEAREEANLSCDVNGGSGCPCWLLPRVDASTQCDARPDQAPLAGSYGAIYDDSPPPVMIPPMMYRRISMSAESTPGH